MTIILGIDTSCYTTSFAVISDENLLASVEIPLQVDSQKGGLRQSDGVFQHVKNLPIGMKQINQQLFGLRLKEELSGIAVSSKPRPRSDSYMPVFVVGESYAETLAACLEIPLIKRSHQEGHIGAGVFYHGLEAKLNNDSLLVFHVSGGTTELLLCESQEQGSNYKIVVIGGTKDISAGQYIDRVGKELGLPFPGGPPLEALAKGSDQRIDIPISVSGQWINFSGPETHTKRLIHKGDYSKEAIALGVQDSVLRALLKVLKNAITNYQVSQVLFVGGVMSNYYIQKGISEGLKEQSIKLWFTPPQYSKDNAIGVAYMGVRQFKKKCV